MWPGITSRRRYGGGSSTTYTHRANHSPAKPRDNAGILCSTVSMSTGAKSTPLYTPSTGVWAADDTDFQPPNIKKHSPGLKSKLRTTGGMISWTTRVRATPPRNILLSWRSCCVNWRKRRKFQWGPDVWDLAKLGETLLVSGANERFAFLRFSSHNT